MTRTEKYEELRKQIDKDNKDCFLNNLDEWLYIELNQKKVKEEKGCKH